MKKKIFMKMIPVLVLVIALAACSGGDVDTVMETGAASESAAEFIQEAASAAGDVQTEIAEVTPVESKIDDEDMAVVDSVSANTVISLSGSQINVAGEGVTVSGTTATITASGVYGITGTLDNGQIIVDTEAEENVVLVLDNASITSQSGAPIFVRNAEKVILTLAEGSSNQVMDGETVLDEEGEPNAAIFSKADLTINGSGSLTVNANFNNGIASKDDLVIVSGNIVVNAVNDGIKGRDSVNIEDGIITINAGADGIQSNNDEDAEKGNVVIEGGSLTITAALDGIQAENALSISGGTFSIITGGGSANGEAVSQQFGDWDMRGQDAEGDSDSAKGLKAGVSIFVSGGTFVIDAADDAVHSDGTIQISGGNLQLASGDDGIHADTSLNISAGTVTITTSYEGVESAQIQIDGGSVRLASSDDGINGSDGSGSQMGGGRGGMGGGSSTLVINGGYVYVNAGGDGIDVNGPVTMNDGVVLVNGPTNNGNGALDYSGNFTLNGGLLVAVGSSGMAQAPSQDSSQYSVSYGLDAMQAAGTVVSIQSQSGQEIVTFTSGKEFQSVVVSSSEFVNGETYLVYLGGTASGSSADGLLTDGTYTPGTQMTSFTVSSVVTYVGSAGGGWGGGGGQPGGGPGGGGRP